MDNRRFMLVEDNEGRPYCIPADKLDEFGIWVEQEADNGGSEPDWAQPIDSTCGFTFTDPEF